MRKPTDDEARDLALLAMMVAKRLGDADLEDFEPQVGAYRLDAATGCWGQERTAVVLDVPIGRGLTTAIDDVTFGDAGRDLGALVDMAAGFAATIEEVGRARDDIASMTFEIRAAVRRQIARAKRRGVSYRLVSALPKGVEATTFGVGDLAVEVALEVLGEGLRPKVVRFASSTAEDVAAEFGSMADVQERRATALATMNRAGATGLIDAVLVRALRGAGADLSDVLSQLHSTDWILDLDLGGDRRLSLHWTDGVVGANVELADGVTWHDGSLTFRTAPAAFGADLAGRRLGSLLSHPLLDGNTVVATSRGRPGCYGSLACAPERLLFDAGDGRLWAA